jgi:hypothetical protein
MPDTEGMTRAERAVIQGAYQRTARWLRGVCSDCAVWQECRLASLPELGGLWGGVTETKRLAVRRAYTGADVDTNVDDLAEQVTRALEAIDAGTPWHDALRAEAIEDNDYFHDFDAYASNGRRANRPYPSEDAA